MKKPAAKPAKGEPSKVSPDVVKKVQQWLELVEKLAQLKELENLLRISLADTFVPDPKEGSNSREIGDFEITVTQPIIRSIDETALDAVMPQLPESYRIVGQDWSLLKYKPTLSLEAYRLMPDDVRKVFDQALTIKPGKPSLTITVKENPTSAGVSTESTRTPATVRASVAKSAVGKVKRKK